MQCEEDGKPFQVASLIVDSDGERLDLRAYDKVLANIAEVTLDHITARVLLRSRRFNITYQDGVIRSVKRE